jgi:hypothetical protein
MDTYIIRVYRFQKDNPRHLVGMVESVKDNRREKMAFTNVDDLWEILNSQMSETTFPRRRNARQSGTGRAKKPEQKGGH